MLLITIIMSLQLLGEGLVKASSWSFLKMGKSGAFSPIANKLSVGGIGINFRKKTIGRISRI